MIETITDDGCILYPQLTTSINNFFILFRVCKESGQWDNNDFYHQISIYDNNGNLLTTPVTVNFSASAHTSSSSADSNFNLGSKLTTAL